MAHGEISPFGELCVTHRQTVSVQYRLMSEHEFPLPPASFEFLVWSLRLQTEAHMGVNPFGVPGADEKPEINLLAARHSIDLLAMLQEKTRNNLSLEEQRHIENTLTELRFRYFQVFEAEQKRKAAAQEAPSVTETQDSGANG